MKYKNFVSVCACVWIEYFYSFYWVLIWFWNEILCLWDYAEMNLWEEVDVDLYNAVQFIMKQIIKNEKIMTCIYDNWWCLIVA